MASNLFANCGSKERDLFPLWFGFSQNKATDQSIFANCCSKACCDLWFTTALPFCEQICVILMLPHHFWHLFLSCSICWRFQLFVCFFLRVQRLRIGRVRVSFVPPRLDYQIVRKMAKLIQIFPLLRLGCLSQYGVVHSISRKTTLNRCVCQWNERLTEKLCGANFT